MNAKKSTVAIALSAIFALTACGGGSSKKKEPVVTPSNTAPTDISLSNTTVDENAAGAVVGTLTAADSSGDTHTFSVDNDMFVINGAELALAEGVEANFEAETSYAVNITATDNGGLSVSKEITIEVNNIEGYDFESKFEEGSSVSYSGQIARHALINELNYFIGTTLKTEVLNGTITSKQQVIDKLNLYFRTSEEQYDNFELKSFGENAKQKFMTDISSSVKKLGGEGGKIAGRDEKGQHKTWGHTDEPTDAFVGWGAQGDHTPESLIDLYFEQLADNVDYYLTVGNARTSDSGHVISEFYINNDGTDLKQLIQKFLLMSVAYSQSTDDYFGHETEGKGLTTDNTTAVSGNTYTNLEHQFDEGYGYFGSARDYLEYSDNEIAGKVDDEGTNGRVAWNGKFDSNNDGEIDLLSEYNFGASVNAAKRDRKATVATDFTTDAMGSLIAGRKLINEAAPNALTDEQMETLKGHRDQAVLAWEKAIAATVVHYINDTNADLEALRTGGDFSFSDLAKHWSELKGFALGLQFNPYSPLSEADFAMFHQYIGDKPVLTIADIQNYQTDLIKARDLLQAAYDFAPENAENW